MKLISFYRRDADPGVGVMLADGVIDVSDWVARQSLPPDVVTLNRRRGVPAPVSGMLRLILAGRTALHALQDHVQNGTATPRLSLESLTLLAPVPRPGKIVAVGRNYADHAK